MEFNVLKLRSEYENDVYFFKKIYVTPDPNRDDRCLICLVQINEEIWMKPVTLENEEKFFHLQILDKFYEKISISEQEQNDLQTLLFYESI